MSEAPLIERAREAFVAYRGLGREIIDELIFALTVANAEVASHRAAIAATESDFGFRNIDYGQVLRQLENPK